MNKILSPVKRSKNNIRVMLLLILCLFINKTAIAQSVNISINIIPPYSPYYSDYSGINSNKVLLVLQNLTNTQQKIKLVGKLEGDNGVRITTYTNYIPLQPIILNPHETRQMNGTSLKDIFDLNNLSVVGVDKQTLARSSRIPAGNYSMCVQAVDYNSRASLSPAAPSGCTSIVITYPEPPILINPVPSAQVNATTPQTIVFNWTNPGTVPVGTQYTIQLAQMPDVQADPNQVLNATSFPMLNQTVSGFSYIYNLSNLGLTPGKKYAWRVIAIDPTGRTLFKNNGVSAASLFTYSAPATPYAGIVKKAPSYELINNKIQISGIINYQYRATDNLPKSFGGIKADPQPLAKEAIQLCFGMCRVTMIPKPDTAQSSRNKLIGKNTAIGVTKVAGLTTDTVVPYGTIGYGQQVQPEGLSFNGLGQVIASTTTTAGGNFTFNGVTTLTPRIVERYSDNTALIYCYYINIKNKHYTDPRTFIYIQPSSDTSSVNIGVTGVFVKNYNLTVVVNRDKETQSNEGKSQGVTVENGNNSQVDIYVLRKEGTGLRRNGDNSIPAVPENEGDNSGYQRFISHSDNPPALLKEGKFDIVAKTTASTVSTVDLYGGHFQASAKFYNMIDELEASEDYYVYAEYKGSSVYFDPVTFGYQPDGAAVEYDPAPLASLITEKTVQLQPSFVSIKVKGVLNYTFRNGSPAPLANVSVSLQSMSWQLDKTHNKQFDFDNKNGNNRVFATSTTDNTGHFELDAGLVDYDHYASGGLFNQFGISQFITVNNPYYGSPDSTYTFEAGNTYDLGQLNASVKEYNYTAYIHLQNGPSSQLGDQRVFLCRKASVNPQQWGVPVDEGTPASVSAKQIKDADSVLYNVIGYAQADANGMVKFTHLVGKDFSNNDDQYYIYSESKVNSISNFSTQYALESSLPYSRYKTWFDFYPPGGRTFVFNRALNAVVNSDQGVFTSVALEPYIQGGVYPQSNTSTSALPGVEVNLYNISNAFHSKTFDADAQQIGTDLVLSYLVTAQQITIMSSQVTGSDGSFYFNNLYKNEKFTGWCLLVYSKAGFITGYDKVNNGVAMTNGQKQTVKGFLLPPVKVFVNVKDKDTGKPITAKIIVGNDFSWGRTYNLLGGIIGATLQSTYGKSVSFTVIPDDNVHYHTQTFTRAVAPPGNIYIADTTSVQTLPDFNMIANKNRVKVTILDAKTYKGVSGFVTLPDVPQSANPIEGGMVVVANKSSEIDFASNAPTYHIKVTADGYADFTELIPNNNTDTTAKSIIILMTPAMTVKGSVTVDGKAVANARVYIKEMTDLSGALTDNQGNYILKGLPINGKQVTLTAVDQAANVVGQSKVISLNMSQDPGVNDNSQGNNSGKSSSPGTGMHVQQSTTVDVTLGVNKAVQLAEVNALTNTKNIYFALNSNTDFDLSNLYGFKLEVEKLDYQGGGAVYLTGRIIVPANSIFNMTHLPYLHFSNVKIQSGSNKSKIAPVNQLVTVDDDDIDISVFEKYTGQLRGFSSGIQIAPTGVVKGSVALSGANVTSNVKFDETGLVPYNEPPTPGAPAPMVIAIGHSYKATEYAMPVFANNITAHQNAIAPYYAFRSGNGVGAPYEGFHYVLNNMYGTDATGYLGADGLHLNSRIHTGLQHVLHPDIALNIGVITVTDQDMKQVDGTVPLSVPLDDWSIKSNKWNITSGALTLDGYVAAGPISVPFTGMEISDTNIGYGSLQLNQLGIAGAFTLNIDQTKTMTSFGYDAAAEYGTNNDKQKGCWSLSLLPSGSDPLTKLTGLPDMDPNSSINIMNISLYSKGGESLIELQQNHPAVTLNGFASFSPSSIESGSDNLSINGTLNFNIPGFSGTQNKVYSLSYINTGGTLIHKHIPIDGLQLTTNGIHATFLTAGQTFTNNALILKGTLQDKASNSPYSFTVNFSKTSSATKLSIDQTAKEKISFDGDQQMANIAGFMGISDTTHVWNNFLFGGDITATGMPSTKPSHMVFEVKGDLVANSASIGVENMAIPGLGNLNLTYDFPKKAIVGSMHIDNISTPIANASADLEMQFGGGKWYILGAATITNLSLPLPVDGAGAAFLVGNTDVSPQMLQIIQPVFHKGILPDGFSSTFQHVKGSLIVAGVEMKLPILPDFDLDLGVADVHIHYGVYANAYLGVLFNDPTSGAKPTIAGGVRAGAYVSIGAGASLGLVCAGISLSADLYADADLTMSNLDFTKLNPVEFYKNSLITLHLGVKANLAGEAYIGAGICNSSCNAVKVWPGVKIPPGCWKKSISGDLSLPLDFKITKDINYTLPDVITASVSVLGHPYSATINNK